MIIIKNLIKTFNGKYVISNLNLKINNGDKIAIIGPSGCGKSTLLRIICGLEKPDAGSVLIDGIDITTIPTKALNDIRMQMGVVFQSAALFDAMTVAENVGFTLLENLKLPDDEIEKIVDDRLRLVKMLDHKNQYPASLSGGMRKRIGLARAIAANPQVVLYDEPTTGLDPILSTQIEDLIVKLNMQFSITSIVVTHQLSTILRTANQIYMMVNGQLLDPLTPSGIQESSNPDIQSFMRHAMAYA